MFVAAALAIGLGACSGPVATSQISCGLCGSPPVAFAYPALAAATTYSVSYVDVSSTSCPLAVAPGGSFTTR